MQDEERNNEPIESNPKGDGTVADEDIKKISGDLNEGVEGGQDKSTEGREDQIPVDGVGAQPDQNDRQTNVASIRDDE